MKCNYKVGKDLKSSTFNYSMNSLDDNVVGYEKVENFDYCKACGGKCCKNAGCIFFPSDFPNLQFDTLVESLETGRVSVSASFTIDLSRSKAKATPTLYLKAREIGKDKLDLFSIPAACLSLGDDGCYFSLDKRPSGGAIMIPRRDGKKCSGPLTDNEQMDLWVPFQQQLKRVVENYSDLRLNVLISRDVENWFYNFSFLEDSKVTKFLREKYYDYLRLCFPVEYQMAMERVNGNNLANDIKTYAKK